MARAREVLLEAKLDTRAAERAAGRLDATLRGLGGSAITAFKRLTLAAVALGGAFLEASRRASLLADAIAKNARNAGVTADQYQRLTFAFEQFGLSGDLVTKALQQANRSARFAAQGSLVYLRALNDIGIGQRELIGLAPERQFLRIIDALGGVSDLSRRNALALDLLGRSGRQLGTLMESGADGVRVLGDQLERVGGVVENPEFFEPLNDAFNLLTRTIQAQFINGLVDAGRQLNELGTDLDDVTRRVGEFVRDATAGVVRVVTGLVDLFLEYKEAVLGVVGAFGALAALNLLGLLNPVGLALVGIVGAFAAIATAIRVVSADWVTWKDVASDALSAIGDGIKLEIVTRISEAVLAFAALAGVLDRFAGTSFAADILGSDAVKALGRLYKDVSEDSEESAAEFSESLEEAFSNGVKLLLGDLEPLLRLFRGERPPSTDRPDVPEVVATGPAPNWLVAEFRRAFAAETLEPVARIASLNLTQALREAFLNQDFSNLGRAFAEKVRRALINDFFDRVTEAFTNFFARFEESDTGATGGRRAGLSAFRDLLPRFHDGGVVPGSRGSDVPILAQAGEIVLPNGTMLAGGGTSVTQVFQPQYVGDVSDAVRRANARDLLVNAQMARVAARDYRTGV